MINISSMLCGVAILGSYPSTGLQTTGTARERKRRAPDLSRRKDPTKLVRQWQGVDRAEQTYVIQC